MERSLEGRSSMMEATSSLGMTACVRQVRSPILTGKSWFLERLEVL